MKYISIDIIMKSIFFILIITLLFPFLSYADVDPFIVRVIYFKPQGAAHVNHEKYNTIINDIREFFRQEMIKLDFGDKTFRIETDDNDDLIIHTVNGKHSGEHYTGEIFNAYYQKISKEIPFMLNNTTNRKEQDNIYIIIIGGVEIINDGLRISQENPHSKIFSNYCPGCGDLAVRQCLLVV